MATVSTGVRLHPMRDVDDDLVRRLAHSAGAPRRPVEFLQNWLAERRRRNLFRVVRVPFDRLRGWHFAPGSGDLVHQSGRYFSVEGIHVQTDYGHVPQWRQPIIHQPDRAVLGILAREFDGVLHFLLQAKAEPGNVNSVQFSPTVQATSSNYLRTHGGTAARYIEYFIEPGNRVLVDVLQSEQGSWFRGKRNRNIVVEVDGDVEHHDDFIWLTLGEIFTLLHKPNMINMDARTALSCLPLAAAPELPGQDGDGFHAALRRSIAAEGGALMPLPEARSWLTARKSDYNLTTSRIPLDAVPEWTRDSTGIRHRDGRYFAVLGVDVRVSNREVASWAQPLLTPRGPGLAAFVVRHVHGVLHLLARADLRPGYRDTVELGPTVQCSPANFAGLPPEQRPRYLDFVLSDAVRVRYDVLHSEEGGRFHHALTRHMVVEVGEDFPIATPADFVWLTLAQLRSMVAASYQVDIEARSLLLCLHAMSLAGPPATKPSQPLSLL